jgi:hypothetical protein
MTNPNLIEKHRYPGGGICHPYSSYQLQSVVRQNARLTEDLRKAHIIIDVQKKVAALLGHPIPEQDPEEKS